MVWLRDDSSSMAGKRTAWRKANELGQQRSDVAQSGALVAILEWA